VRIALNVCLGYSVTATEGQTVNDSVNATAKPIANAEGSSSPTNDRMAINSRHLYLNVGLTGILIGVVIFGSLYLTPATPGQPRQSIGIILIVASLPNAVLLLLSLIERLLPPAGPRKSLRSWVLHFQMSLFVNFMFVPAGIVTVIISSALSRYFGFNLGLVDLRFAEGRGLLALLGAVWVSAAVGDFFFYWFHRTLHKTSFLWQHHKLHHMDRELEAMTSNRQNWIEAFLQMVFMAIPMAILFKTDAVDGWQLGALGVAMATILSTLLTLGHMNVRFQVGWASLFFCSPQVHRIHHSRLPQHRDKNFAFVLPLWDVLFGTYCAPARDEFPPCGVDGEKEIQSFWESQIFTQREWWRMFQGWRRRGRDSALA